MTFLWPSMLYTLVIIPVFIGLYLAIYRKRRAQTALFKTGLSDFRTNPGFRRHIPPILFALSAGIILFALARPQAEVQLPRVEGTVILVFDVSGSMAADDVSPSRMEAAKAAAREFILSQPETVKIGVVSFSGSGFTVQSPTNDSNILQSAIDRLKPTSGTSLGHGILVGLKTIAVDAGLLEEELLSPENLSATPTPAPEGEQRGPSQENLLAILPEGSYPASVIVVLSDGENNMAVDPLEAALAAAEREVRVDTLGFGTTAGTTLELEGFTVFTTLNEPLLQQIAEIGGGSYYAPQQEQDPKAVYANLSPQLVVKTEKMEITALFASAGILALMIGSIFSMVWFNRFV